MKIEIASTGEVTRLDGVPVRVWVGRTKGGVDCLVFVHRLAVRRNEDQGEFERELQDMGPPMDVRVVTW